MFAKFLQDGFHERVSPINIWFNNAQEDFVGSVLKLLCAYGVGRRQYEFHKQNHNPAERRVQEIKVTTRTVLDCYVAPN